jgi:hypothetical protein
VALVEVDVIGAQPREREVDLLEDLLPGEAAVAVHGEEELRCEHIRVAWPVREHVTEEFLRPAPGVDVGGVDEVDPHLERFRYARRGLFVADAAAVGQPRAEADLGDFEVAGPEAAVAHR